MSIYARYFNQEILVKDFDELMDFLSSIPEIPINQHMVDDVRAYVEGDMPYPKRYKIRPRVYFILIKTNAATMAEFKSNRRENADEDYVGESNAAPMPEPFSPTQMHMQPDSMLNKKMIRTAQLAEKREGWYQCTLVFKRVIQVAATAKFRYTDTQFKACVYANSANECYNRIIEHLKNRVEIDKRSQFPSARGNNFTFEYLGMNFPS